LAGLASAAGAAATADFGFAAGFLAAGFLVAGALAGMLGE
jgi:hypothetical protein